MYASYPFIFVFLFFSSLSYEQEPGTYTRAWHNVTPSVVDVVVVAVLVVVVVRGGGSVLLSWWWLLPFDLIFSSTSCLVIMRWRFNTVAGSLLQCCRLSLGSRILRA